MRRAERTALFDTAQVHVYTCLLDGRGHLVSWQAGPRLSSQRSDPVAFSALSFSHTQAQVSKRAVPQGREYAKDNLGRRVNDMMGKHECHTLTLVSVRIGCVNRPGLVSQSCWVAASVALKWWSWPGPLLAYAAGCCYTARPISATVCGCIKCQATCLHCPRAWESDADWGGQH